MERIQKLYQEYEEISKVQVEHVWALGVLREKFRALLLALDHIITRDDLEKFLSDYQDVEEDFLEVKKEIEKEEGKAEEDSLEEVEDDTEIVTKKTGEVEEELERREQVSSATLDSYHVISKTTDEVLDQIKKHRQNIQDYLVKIDQIRAREITVYRSLITSKSLQLATSYIRRGVEAKLLSSILPKKVAEAYLAIKVMQDATRMIQKDDMVITRFEVDTSYYDELLHEEGNIKNYRSLVTGSLVELKRIKSEYKNVCANFPDEVLYQENLKKLDELEKTLIEEALEIEEVVNEYDSALDYNEQRIKSLKG